MAKAKKLPSGMWRTLVYSHTEKIYDEKSKTYKDKRIYESFTSETKAESEFLAAEFVKNKSEGKTYTSKKKSTKEKNKELTVGEIVDKYIELKSLNSPTTVSSYKKIRRTAFQKLMAEKAKDLDEEKMQLYVNDESKRITRRGTQVSPKTIKDGFCLINTALYQLTGERYNITLPKAKRKFIELPEPSEVLNIVKGTEIELPCLIAMWMSYSMSEIRGLKCSSVRNGLLYIDQVVVDVDGVAVEKEIPKAEKRTRKVAIPNYIFNLIEQQETYKHYLETGEDGYLIPLTASQITGRYRRLLNKHDMHYVSFHKLRHLNASVMLMLNIPEKYAMERGGWKTPHTMKSVYQHTFSKERMQVDRKIDDYFNSIMK